MKRFLLLIFFLMPVAHAANLDELLDHIKSMQADFVQTVFDNHNRAIQKSYGTMAVIRPGRFRWVVKKPIPQTIIANQAKMWIYDPDLQQVTVRSVKHVAGNAPALLLSQVNIDLNQNFRVAQMPAKNNWQWFVLTPKNKNDMFSATRLGFNHNELKEMRLQDNLGHSIQIQFSHVTINKTLSAALFTFKIPPRTDVINET